MKQWLADVAAGKTNGKYWANLQTGGLEIELNKDNVPAAVQQQVMSVASQVQGGQIQTDPLGPLTIGTSLQSIQNSFFIAIGLQQSRN